MLPIPDEKAETITHAVITKLDDLGLDLQQMVALGSDGASVMLGKRTGVAARLKDSIPWLIANHCVAHRLALAAGQAAVGIPYLQKFKSILDQLFRFYKYSPVRTAGLHEIQKALDQPVLKLKHACDTRWLSHDMAVTANRRCLPAVVSSLSREAQERHEAQALGLLKFVQTYNFVAAIHTFSDVLPPLTLLSKAFQASVINLSVIKPLVNGTKATLESLLYIRKGENLDNLNHYLEENHAVLNIDVSERKYNAFEEQLILNHYDGSTLLDKIGTRREWQQSKHTVYADNTLKQNSMSEMLKLLANTESDISIAFPYLSLIAKLYFTSFYSRLCEMLLCSWSNKKKKIATAYLQQC